VTEPYEWEALPDAVIECESDSPLGVELVGAPTPPEDCDYSLVLTDTWGDGWDGGEVELVIDGDSETYTIDFGVTETFDLNDLPHGSSISISYTAGGSPEENEYVLFDGNNDPVFQDGQFFVAPTEGLVFEGVVDCSLPGPDFVFEWSPPDQLNNPNLQYPLAQNIVDNTTFTVIVYEAGHPDCAVSDEMTLNIAGALSAGPDMADCLMSYELEGSSVGAGEWSGPPEVSFADPNAQVVISFFDGIAIDVAMTEPTCFGDCDGAVIVTGTGGNIALGSDFIYTFNAGNPGATLNEVIDLCSGNMQVILEDNDGCQDQLQFFLDQPPAPIIDSVYSFRESCFGFCDGIIEIITAVEAEYSFDDGGTWVSDSLRNDLCPGDYALRIRDANGCQGSASAFIGSPIPPIAGFSADPIVTSWLSPSHSKSQMRRILQ
jgi:hypothetical protein